MHQEEILFHDVEIEKKQLKFLHENWRVHKKKGRNKNNNQKFRKFNKFHKLRGNSEKFHQISTNCNKNQQKINKFQLNSNKNQAHFMKKKQRKEKVVGK